MHQIQFPLGLRPQTPLRELRALSGPTEPLAVFKGPTSKGRGGEKGGGKRRGKKREREGRRGNGREGMGQERREGREERGMGASIHCDFRKSAPMLTNNANIIIQYYLAPYRLSNDSKTRDFE